MQDNTIVTASNMTYIWGVFLLIASMRRTGMNEHVIVFADKYSNAAKTLLHQFKDVEIIDAPPSVYSMTCRKPEAMLYAKTKFVTWVDCDAFFLANASSYLAPFSEDMIHIRLRGEKEFLDSNLSEIEPDGKVVIAHFMSDVWRKDVAELDVPRLNSCCSACIMCLSMKWRNFLLRWKTQMEKVLNKSDVGVVDKSVPAYFQTDESVLNSLLCFMRDAPVPMRDYALNKLPHFVHFIGTPKPWVSWRHKTMRFYDEYLSVVDFLLENHYNLPTPLPPALSRRYKLFFKIFGDVIFYRAMFSKKFKKILAKFARK